MLRTILLVVLFTVSSCIPRPTEAKTKRSSSARAEFKRLHPCPSTGAQRGACPGWVVDHITALACGGTDAPFNMQWQTVGDAKAKDRWERVGCSANHTQ